MPVFYLPTKAKRVGVLLTKQKEMVRTIADHTADWIIFSYTAMNLRYCKSLQNAA